MEQAEALIKRKRRTMEHHLRMYTPSQLKSMNVNRHAGELKEIKLLVLDLILTIEEHIDEFSTQVGQERIDSLNSEIPTLENKFMISESSFVSKLKNVSNQALILPSMNNLSLSDSFQIQQTAAKKKVKAKLEAVMEDLVKLSKKASKVED